MQELTARLPVFELYTVTVGWLLFAVIFFSRKRTAAAPEQARNPRSLIGLILQIFGFVIIRLGLREQGGGFLPLGAVGEISTAVVAFVIILASLYLTYAAVRTLGKQWSLTARLMQGHELVISGPYRLVRHPIYTGMFGMLLGTAIAISQWPALVLGSAVFLFGTVIRIRAEEQLLITTFGDDYRNYARTVPALIPWWPRARQSTHRAGPPPG